MGNLNPRPSCYESMVQHYYRSIMTRTVLNFCAELGPTVFCFSLFSDIYTVPVVDVHIRHGQSFKQWGQTQLIPEAKSSGLVSAKVSPRGSVWRHRKWTSIHLSGIIHNMHLCTVYILYYRCLVLERPYQSISEGKSLFYSQTMWHYSRMRSRLYLGCILTLLISHQHLPVNALGWRRTSASGACKGL